METLIFRIKPLHAVLLLISLNFSACLPHPRQSFANPDRGVYKPIVNWDRRLEIIEIANSGWQICVLPTKPTDKIESCQTLDLSRRLSKVAMAEGERFKGFNPYASDAEGNPGQTGTFITYDLNIFAIAKAQGDTLGSSRFRVVVEDKETFKLINIIKIKDWEPLRTEKNELVAAEDLTVSQDSRLVVFSQKLPKPTLQDGIYYILNNSSGKTATWTTAKPISHLYHDRFNKLGNLTVSQRYALSRFPVSDELGGLLPASDEFFGVQPFMNPLGSELFVKDPIAGNWKRFGESTGCQIQRSGSMPDFEDDSPYADGRYLIYLNMNEAPQNRTKTPDISGHNAHGSLHGNVFLSREPHPPVTTNEVPISEAVFKPGSSIVSDVDSKLQNSKNFTVEVILKPLDNFSDLEQIDFIRIPEVLTLGLDRKAHLTFKLGALPKLTSLPNSNIKENTWSKIRLSWSQTSSLLRISVNDVPVYEKPLNPGPLHFKKLKTRVIIGPRNLQSLKDKPILAVRAFKFSNIARVGDEPALYNADVIKLGALLFKDKRLSKDGTVSCMSCHIPEKAFTDGLALRRGLNGKPLQFNSPSLIGRVFGKNQTWIGKTTSIGDQAMIAFTHKNEMGSSANAIIKFLNREPGYAALFKSAFGKPATVSSLQTALAAFVSSIVSKPAKYDEVISGRQSFTNDELAGYNLFFGKARCVTCHNGPNFSDEKFHNNGHFTSGTFGLIELSGRPQDNRKVKTPSLRHLSLTAPYMHDGSVPDLETVIFNYLGAGYLNDPLVDGNIKAILMNEKEISQLKSFLLTLDSGFEYGIAVN